MPSSMGSSQPRDQTQVSCMAGRSFTDMREVPPLDVVPQNPPLHQEEKNRPHDIKELRKESIHLFFQMEEKMKHFISVFPKSNATSIAFNLIVYFTSENTLEIKKDWTSFLSKRQHKVANSFFFFKDKLFFVLTL